MVTIEEYKLLQSSHPEFVIHPTNGKIPLIPKWQELTKTPDNIEEYLKKGCNVGLVCGAVSGTDVIDFDSELFYKTVFPEGSNTLEAKRTEGRRHVYIKHSPIMVSKSDSKYLHIDFQSDKRNLILPPSIHASGDLYHWVKPNVPIRELTSDELKNINFLFNLSNELKEILKSCGNCFSKLLDVQPNMNSGEDRQALLGLFAELKLNGANDGLLRFVSKLIFKEKYNKKDTDEGLKHIDVKKPHKCDTLRSDFGKYFAFDIDGVSICSNCERWRKILDKEGKGKKKVKEPAQLPQIPIETIEVKPITIGELLTTYKKYQYVEEEESITIPLSETISNFAPIEPDIMGIIGASGSGKTEFIRALGEMENQYIYPVSSITGHTLVSGFEDNIDLAPSLRNRLLTIKDFTTLLAKKSDEVSEIFADLRELTDGHIGKDFGSGVKKHYTGIHTSILFGCTNAIEKYNSMFSLLGQRITFFRPKSDRKKAMLQAMKNAGKEAAFRDELHKITMQFVQHILTTKKERLTNLSHIPEDYEAVIGELVCFLSIVRTYIDRDFKGDMARLPEPEYPTRLAKTFCKLVDAHSVIYDREPIEDDLEIAYRLILDNIPTERLKILNTLLNGEEHTTTEVQVKAKVSTGFARRVLEDLKALEIIECISLGTGHADVWILTNEDYRQILLKIQNFDEHGNIKTSTDTEQEKGVKGKGEDTNLFLKVLHKIKSNNKEKSENGVVSDSHPSLEKNAEPQQKKDNSEICGICGKGLNGNSERIPRLGLIHPSCKHETRTIKVLVDIPTFADAEGIRRSLNAGDIVSLPVLIAMNLVYNKMAIKEGW